MSSKKTEKKSSESLSEFLSFWRGLQTSYEHSHNLIEEDSKSTNDLLHQIELGNYAERRKYATKLAHVRQHRRIHKNYIDINQSLYTAFQKPEFIKVYRELEQILGEVRKKEKMIEGDRYYRPRIRTDLTIKTIPEESD